MPTPVVPHRAAPGRRFTAVLAACALAAVPVLVSTHSATAAAVPSVQEAALSPVVARAAAGRPVVPEYFGAHAWGVQDSTQRAIAGSIRLPAAEWHYVQPSPGVWDWRGIDGQLRTASDYGVANLLVVLGGTPDWAAGPNESRDPRSPVRANPPRSNAEWDTYVAAVATHLRGRSVAFQAWNEADLTTFWNGSPERMAELTARAYAIVKRISPEATFVGASSTMRLGYTFDRFYPRYLAALARLGWPVDVLSAHTYPPGTGGPATFQQYLRKLRTTIARAGGSRLPLWITEMNYGLKGPGPKYPHRSITGATAAAWVARTYLEGLRFGVGRLYWYSQIPDPSLGIQMWAGHPGLTGQRVVATWLRGATWRGCTVRNGLVRCAATTQRGPAVFVWSESRARTFTAPPGSRRVCNAFGACSRVRPGQPVRVTGMPLRVGA